MKIDRVKYCWWVLTIWWAIFPFRKPKYIYRPIHNTFVIFTNLDSSANTLIFVVNQKDRLILLAYFKTQSTPSKSYLRTFQSFKIISLPSFFPLLYANYRIKGIGKNTLQVCTNPYDIYILGRYSRNKFA